MKRYGIFLRRITSVAFILLLLNQPLYLMLLIHAQTPEGHIVIDALSAYPNPAYADQSITISVTVYNKDAGILGADVYIEIYYADGHYVRSPKLRVDKGKTVAWTDTKPASDPYYYRAGRATYEVQVYWDDYGTWRFQDYKRIEINVIPVKLVSGGPSSQITVNPGGTFTVTYGIQNCYGASVNVGLGASICSGSTCYNDPANDKVVTISGGSSSTQTRPFKVPLGTPAGTYDLVIALWSGTPGSSEQWVTMKFTGVIKVEPTKYSIYFYTNPSNVGSITFSGTTYTNGQSGSYAAGSYSVTANVPSGYIFTGWSTSGSVTVASSTSTSTTATVSGPGSITANFQQSTYSYTVYVSGLLSGSTTVYLDGSPKVALSNGQSYTFTGLSGSHTVSVDNPVSGGSGVRYYCSQPSITISGQGSYTFTYVTQYYLTMQANPSNGGTVSPSSGWYNSGQQVQISASQASGWSFVSWTGSGSGSYSGSNNPATITMNGPITETANFQQVVTPSLSVQVSANPSSITTSQSSTITVTVTSGGSAVSGASVSLSCSPSGPSLNPASGTTGSDGRFTATFSSSTTGTFTITATASKSGYNSGSGSTQITVSQTPPPFDFSISVSPSSRTITAGQSTTYSVTVSLVSGTAQTVSLSLSGQHSTMSYSFNPSSGSPTFTSTLTVSTTSSTPAQTYTLTVTGTGGGITRQQQVTLIVQSSPTIPTEPQNLVATAGDGRVTLSWSAPRSDGGSAITNYRIYRRTSSTSQSLIATVGNVLSYTDTSVTNGVTYYYQVSAVNSVGEGPKSNEASATPTSTPQPDFSISASPNSLSITLPSSGTASKDSTIKVTSVNGFSSQVSLSASWVGTTPSGVTCTFSKNTVTPPSNGQDSSILTITASSSASTGSFTLRVTGTSGSLTHYADITVVISYESSLSVQVSANPNSITTEQYSTITVTVSSNGIPVPGATVILSNSGGSLSQASGTTDSNGRFTTTFFSSTSGTFIITASASKSGYNSGSSTIQVIVTYIPKSLEVIIESPQDGTNYKEGETICLKALVKSGSSPVSGATITFYLDDQSKYSVQSDQNGYAVYNIDPPYIGTHKVYCKAEKAGYVTAKSQTVTFSYMVDAVADFSIRVGEQLIIDMQIDKLLAKAGNYKPTEFIPYELPLRVAGWTIYVAFSAAELQEIINTDGPTEYKKQLLENWLAGKVAMIISEVSCRILTDAAITGATVLVPPAAPLTILLKVGAGIGCSYLASYVDEQVRAKWPEIKQKIKDYFDNVFNNPYTLYGLLKYLYSKVISITGGSSLVLTVVDPMGRRVGGVKVSEAWLEVNEVSNAIYSGIGSHPQTIIIPQPVEGKYTVIIVGNETGSYSLKIESYLNGSLLSLDKFNGTIKSGETQTINYVNARDTVRILPIVYGFNLPARAEVGEKLQLSINASKPELNSVKVGFLNNNGEWHNYTAVWKEGVYSLSVDTSGFAIGDYIVYLSITDGGYVQTWTYPFILIGRLTIVGYLPREDVVQGEKIRVSLLLKDQDGSPVNSANLSVSLAGKKYPVFSIGNGQYEAQVDSSGLEGSYTIEITASKEGYRQADYVLPVIIRPWWWPYLPYATAIATVVIISMVGYVVHRSRRKEEKIIIGSEDLLKVLNDANNHLNKGDYAEAVRYSAETLRSKMLEKLGLSRSTENEDLIKSVAALRKDIDLEKLKYVLRKGEECTYARYKPSKEEAEKVLKYSEELLSKL